MQVDTGYLDRPYHLAGRVIDPLAGTVCWNQESQPLRRKQLEVLAWLASAGTAMVTRTAFIDGIWAGNALVGEAALTDTISSLRRALHDTDSNQPLIRTIPRRGYQLTSEARFDELPTADALIAGAPVPGRPDWLLVRLLTQSAVSETWLARQQGGQTNHVFRFCRNEDYLRLLQREVTLLRYLRETLADRRDTATIIDWQLDEPPYYLELDYATLGSLAEWSAAQGGLTQIPLGRRLGWMAEAAAALSGVHAAGIVHRQLSAAAILLDGPESEPRVKLGEFGLGELSDRSRLDALKITAAGLTLSGEEPAGPPCYLPPERLSGAPATAAGDVHALGVLLYQVIAGDLERSLPHDWPARIEPQPLRELITRCLAPDPQGRPSAAEIAEGLRTLSSEAPSAPAAGPSTQLIDTPNPPAAAETAAPARTIGPYRILEPLGDGGMGTVYLAEQRSPVQRTVALKVIKAGMDSTQILARFEAERQALALMNHVNVASVFDASTTELGQPYFAMEYVPGLDITSHCDQQELDFRERIELFLQVCDGVTHAHQKGLIHRDLKPGNILVKKPQGQSSTVKIIDFGVAKSLHGKLGTHTAHTRIGSFVGTPVYSSPEQVLGHQADVDTRADIYSLGVVLYELLAGVTPYSDQELSDKSQAELVRFLTQSDPPDPASRFQSLGPEDEAEIAKQRSTTVERLIEVLGADLSWIVAKCLERDPDDRYGSALELKRDLQRWLEDKPIEARPSTRWYRWRKLIKRHRATVAIAATITLILLGTTTAAILGYQRAETALKQAQLAAAFQVDQMKAIDPQAIGLGVRRGLINAVEARLEERSVQTANAGMTQLEELLDGVEFTSLITAQLDQQFFKPSLQVIARQYAEYPALQASLWQSSADTLFELGLYEAALEPQELAIAKRTKLYGNYDQLTLESKAGKGRILAAVDRTPEAAALLDQTLEDMREHTGLDYQAALDALATRAAILQMEGYYQPAQKALQEVAERSRRLLGENSPRALYADVVLARTLRRDRAIPMLENAVAGLRTALGSDHRETLEAMAALAWELYGQQRTDEAIVLAREVVQRRMKLLGDGHPEVINAEGRLAALLGEALQFREASPLFRSAIAGTEELHGKHGQKTAIIRGNYGYALWRNGNLVEAEKETRFAADTLRAIYGPDTPGESTYAINLAAVLRDMGRYQDSKTLFDARISLLTEINGSRVLLADARKGMGQMYLTQGDIEQACKEFQAGIDALANTTERTVDLLPKIKGALGYCRYRRDGDKQAILMLNEVIDQQKSNATTDILDLATSLIYRAHLLNDEKLWESALESADEALRITEAALPDGHYIMVRALTQKIRALRAMKKEAEASESHQAARRIIDKTTGLDPAYGRELTAAMKTAAGNS
ncbi:MAG: protein kinase [Lysobacterales bacterium]